jgi:hypothetical protein
VLTDSISNCTGGEAVARFIFSVFETNGHSASGDDCSSHSNVYDLHEIRRTIGGAGCAVISAVGARDERLDRSECTRPRLAGALRILREAFLDEIGDRGVTSGTSVSRRGRRLLEVREDHRHLVVVLDDERRGPAINANKQQPSA